MEKIEMIIRLTLAKLEILKLKSVDSGYDWAHVNKEDQNQINETLVEIDRLLKELKQ